MANVNVSVTINASGAQTGSSTFVSSMSAMQGAVSAFSPQLAHISQQMNQLIGIVNNLSQANRNAGSSFTAFLGANLAADAVRGLSDAFQDLIIQSTLYAARTEELGVALGAIAKASGESTRVIAQQEFAMKQLNITTQDARQTLARFIQADLDLNKSGALARTAQDLAVIAGVSTSEEINKLIIGIQTLQSRNLRTAGVFLTVDEVLDRLAKTTNRARDSFSTFEKQQAVLNAVLEFGARVTGTYEAAMETASKQMRSLERLVFEAQNAIGNQFVPVMALAIKATSDLFIWIESHPNTFKALITSVGILAATFVVLNTNVVAATLSMAAFTVQGVIRMVAAIPGLNINLNATATALRLTGAAATTATAQITGLQLALGGLGAVLGIAGLILSLGAAFTDFEAPAEKFNRITDTQILQSTAYIKSLQERTNAVKEFQGALKLVNDIPQLRDAQPALTGVSDTTTQAAQSRALVGDLQNQVSALRGEEASIRERIQSGLQKDIVEEARSLARLIDLRNANNESLKVQQGRLESALQVDQKNQLSKQAAIEQLKQLTGGNEGLIITTALVTARNEEYSKILVNLNANERAVLATQDQRIEATDRLIESFSILEKREAEVLSSRISGLSSNIKIFKDEIETTSSSIRTRETELVVLQRQLKVYEDLSAQGQKFIIQDAIIGDQQTQRVIDIEAATKATEGAIKDLNKVIGENGVKLEENQGKLAEQYRQLVLISDSYKGSTEELYNLLNGLKLFPGTLDEFNVAFTEAQKFMKGFTDQTEKVALGINDIEQQIKNIRPAQGTLVTTEETAGVLLRNLDKQREAFVKDLARRRQLSEEAAKLLFQEDPEVQERFIDQFSAPFKQFSELTRKKFHDDLVSALSAALEDPSTKLENEEDVKKRYIGLFKAFEAIEKEAKKAVRETKTEFEKMTESFNRTEEQIKSFLNAGSKEFDLRIKLEEAERTKKDLEAIFTLRHKLGIPLDIPIKRENVQRARAELEILAKVFDQIRDAQNEAYEARLQAGAPVIQAEVRLETQLLKLVRERRDVEEELAANIAASILKRTQLEKDANNVQRIQAKAFLEAIQDEQASLENALISATQLSIARGDFSFADNNEIIQKALTLANDPVVNELTNTQKVIQDSVKIIKDSQVDFSKAIGDTVLRSTDLLKSELTDSNKELRHHSNLLNTIIDNTSQSVDELVGTMGIGARGNLTTPQMNSVLRMAGATPDQARILAAIGMAESRGNPSAYNPGNPLGTTANQRNERSFGLFQINVGRGANSQYANRNLKDPLENAKVALEILRTQGYDAWTTFTSGAYLKWLEGASQASNSALSYATTKVTSKVAVGTLIKNLTNRFLGRGLAISPSAFTTEEAQYGALFEAAGSNLGLPQTPGNFALFRDKAGIQALGGAQSQQKDLIEQNNLRERSLQLRVQIIKTLDEEHARELRIIQAEKDFERAQKVRIDNQFELVEAERELNRLRTDGLVITEQLQEAALERIRAEQEAQKESIRLQSDQEFRDNPATRERHITTLIQNEYNARWKAEQDLEDRITILNQNLLEGYTQSIEFRKRVERELYAERLELHEDLDRTIIELDEQLVHHAEVHSKQYAIAWREALLDLSTKHAEAIKRILNAQAELADNNIYDVARVRATVLDSISQTEDISESIGGLFNSTFKVYSDEIDLWIDKTTENMGNLGKIFNGFFKSISRRAIGTVQSTLLDAIFPPTAEEAAAKTSSVFGSSTGESIFRNTQAAIAGLGATSLQTAQVEVAATTTTVSALHGLAYSADVATQALLQIGSMGGIGTGSLGGGGLTRLVASSSGGGLSRALAGIGTGLGTITNPRIGGAAAIANIFSGSGTFNTGGFAGGFPSGIPSSVSALLNRMRTEPLSSPQFLGSALPLLSQQSAGRKGIFGQLLGSGGPLGGVGSLFSKAGLKGFLGGIGPQLPFMGLGIGAGLGGSSLLGNILGGVGGGLLGLSGSALLGGLFASSGGALGTAAAGALGGSSGLFGISAALLTNPFTIAAGAALLIGAALLGRNSRRRQEEKTRDQLGGDLRTRLYQILADVKADKMDGQVGITQAQEAIEAYRQQVLQFKDRKTRDHALGFINDLQPIVQQIQQAAKAQQHRREIEDKLIPTYAYGGVASSNVIGISRGERLDFPSGGSYRVPGSFDGRDDIMALVPRGTTIRSPHPNAIYRYGVGGIAGVAPANRVSSVSPSRIQQGAFNGTVIVVFSKDEALRLANSIPNSVIADKAAADSKLRPYVLPAAVGEGIERTSGY